MKTIGIGTAVLLVLATACAGGQEEADGGDSPTTSVEAEPSNGSDDGASTTAPPSDGEAAEEAAETMTDLAPGTAVVTVGSETFEFAEVTCETYEGLYEDNSRLTAGGTDDQRNQLNVDLFPGGTDVENSFNVHYVSVRNSQESFRWSADVLDFPSPDEETIPEGGSQIDSVTIEGGYAVGTATFIDTEAVSEAHRSGDPVPESMTGSFEINC